MKISENHPNHLFQRLLRAKAELEPVAPSYCIVWTQPNGTAAVTTPDPNWLAAAMHGGVLPPVEVYHQLRCEWVHDDGSTIVTDVQTHPGDGWHVGKVLNGHLLHIVHPIGPMTEEEAMEYLLQKDVPRAVWADHDRVNFPRFYITDRSNLPETRAFRNAWRLAPPLEEAA